MTEKISFSAAPMYSFEEWVNTTAEHGTVGAVHKWANQLIELGTSWDSFRRSSEEVVTDLVAGGIPLLAARDIYIVASKVVARTTMPMAIFWVRDCDGIICCTIFKVFLINSASNAHFPYHVLH